MLFLFLVLYLYFLLTCGFHGNCSLIDRIMNQMEHVITRQFLKPKQGSQTSGSLQQARFYGERSFQLIGVNDKQSSVASSGQASMARESSQ